MKVHTYITAGGKDLIRNYIDSLPVKEQAEGYYIIRQLEKMGVSGLEFFKTRQIKDKVWEIKFYRHNRIFYVLVDSENIYLLHACKKQKGKARKSDIKKALTRVKDIP